MSGVPSTPAPTTWAGATAATAEKAYAAEKAVGYVRAFVIALNTFAYLFLLDPAGTIPWLAYSIIGVAWAYAFLFILVEPYRRYPVMLSSYFSSATDAALIATWLIATGGAASPFYVLWFASLVAVAFRFDSRATAITTVAYAALYVGLCAAMGQFTAFFPLIVIRVGYVFVIGALGALLARESLAHITARIEMRGRMEEARSAEAKFRGLLEAAPDAIVILDRAGRIALVNSRTEHMFGHPRNELLGQPVDVLIPGHFLPGPDLSVQRYFDESRARPLGDGGDAFGVHKDGTRFPVEVSLSPMEATEGGLTTAIIRDVSDRKRVESERLAAMERNREIERLRELDRFKTQFINTAAHELGTPLTPIRLQVHMLKSSGEKELGERQRRAVGVIDRNVDRLMRLVQEVLDAARLQAGRISIRQEALDVNELVREAVESFDAQAQEASVQLTTRLAPEARAEGDAQRVTQVLFNLIGNAIKFTQRGGRVSVSTSRAGQTLVVSVADTGAGLTAAQMARLFQPFTQVHDAMERTRAGTGLGLYISRGIVEAHGGRIWCESEGPGLGSTFHFALPVGAEGEPVQVAQPPAPSPAQPARRENLTDRARDLI